MNKKQLDPALTNGKVGTNSLDSLKMETSQIMINGHSDFDASQPSVIQRVGYKLTL